jgi:hypothetical protein
LVYFIKDPQTNLVKIGYSKNVLTRLEELRYQHGKNLSILFLRSGNRREEKRMHQVFAASRVHGEWFSFDPAMVDYAESGIEPTKAQNIGKTVIDGEVLLRVEKWAKEQNRPLSNAVERLLTLQLESLERKKEE